MTSPPLTPFYFIRHGETDWNKNFVYMGHQDIPLNATGIAQAQAAAQLLKNEPIQHIATSPLTRARATAQIIADLLQKPVTIIDALEEAYLGEKEGTPVTPSPVEFPQDFDARVLGGLGAALALPGPVLIVAHGGVYQVIRRALGQPAIRTPNCAPFYHRPPDRPGNPWLVWDVLSLTE